MVPVCLAGRRFRDGEEKRLSKSENPEKRMLELLFLVGGWALSRKN